MTKTSAALAACFTLVCTGSMRAQQDWKYFGQDQGGTRFSNLKQVDTTNVKALTRAWTFHAGEKAATAGGGGFPRDPTADALIAFALPKDAK